MFTYLKLNIFFNSFLKHIPTLTNILFSKIIYITNLENNFFNFLIIQNYNSILYIDNLITFK